MVGDRAVHVQRVGAVDHDKKVHCPIRAAHHGRRGDQIVRLAWALLGVSSGLQTRRLRKTN